MKKCKYCKAIIDDIEHGNKQFCSQECRMLYRKMYRKRYIRRNGKYVVVYKKKNHCIDCRKVISGQAIRCGSCARSGKNNPMYGIHRYGVSAPNYKGGNKCIDCGKPIKKINIRCIDCYKKLPKITNMKYYCIDCGKEIVYRSNRCRSCARREIWRAAKEM